MSRSRVRAFVGIGSNLNEPLCQVETALRALACLPQSELCQSSSLYRNAPMGPADQPDYVNAVAEVATALKPQELLDELLGIEARQGRVRAERWGPRTLDLDLLLYGDLELDEERLQLPHPGIADRPFVLFPLYEIAAELEIPGRGSLGELLAGSSSSGLSRIEQQEHRV